MFVFKFIIISIISAIFLFGNAESQAGLIKNLARGIQNTVDNAVDLVQENAGTGLVGNILTGAGNVAKAAIAGTERIVSEADDHLGDAARAAHHSLASLIKRGNETIQDLDMRNYKIKMEGSATSQVTFLTSDDCCSLRKEINSMLLQRYCSKVKTASDVSDAESTVSKVFYIKKKLCSSSQMNRRLNFNST